MQIGGTKSYNNVVGGTPDTAHSLQSLIRLAELGYGAHSPQLNTPVVGGLRDAPFFLSTTGTHSRRAEHTHSMSIRYVVRPRGIISTPRRLKEVLNARYTISADRPKRFLEGVDFFLAYPYLERETPAYASVRAFYGASKFSQRRILHQGGVPIPKTVGIHEGPFTGPFVVRPMQHMGGRDFTVVSEMPSLIRGKYVSQLFPKKWEYRVIFCKGQKVSTLLKRTPSGIANDVAWNHSNGCFFVSVTCEDNDRLRHTDCYAKLAAHPVVAGADLVAADVLLDRNGNYVVCELNFAPGISIQGTLDTIRTTVNHAQI